MIYLRIVSVDMEVKSTFEKSILSIIDYCYNNKKDFPFLSSIDYYGVTYFSHLQIEEHILSELEQLSLKKTKLSYMCNDIIKYLKTVGNHCFIQVLGD